MNVRTETTPPTKGAEGKGLKSSLKKKEKYFKYAERKTCPLSKLNLVKRSSKKRVK